MKILFLTCEKPAPTARPLQQRCYNPVNWLTSRGVRAEVRWLYERNTDLDAEILVLNRAVLDSHTSRIIRRAKAGGRIVVYETDDLLFDPRSREYLLKIGRSSHASLIESRAAALLACDCAIVSTDYLAKAVEMFEKEAWVLHNGIGFGFSREAERVFATRTTPDIKFHLGYFSGSSTHDYDFSEIKHALAYLMERFSHLHLTIVGSLTLPDTLQRFEHRITRKSYVPYEQLPQEIGCVHLNLVPLEIDEPFCEAKSELKYLEAAACGVVSVASATAPFSAAIVHGETGFLAHDEQAWIQILESLILSPAQLTGIGNRAREDVLNNYLPDTRSRQWIETLEAISNNFYKDAQKRRDWLSKSTLDFHAQAGAILDKVRNFVQERQN